MTQVASAGASDVVVTLQKRTRMVFGLETQPAQMKPPPGLLSGVTLTVSPTAAPVTVTGSKVQELAGTLLPQSTAVMSAVVERKRAIVDPPLPIVMPPVKLTLPAKLAVL